MRFEPGRVLLRRYHRGGRLVFVQSGRVISDDDRGLLLWVPAGAAGMRRVLADGRSGRDVALREWLAGRSTLRRTRWRAPGVLKFMPPGEPWSVWWFWTPVGTFRNWYVNLEDPGVRWDDGDPAGVDTADRALDVVVDPDLNWHFKDEDEFAERTGHPLFWDATQAQAIRADGVRAVRPAGAGAFPFDGTWTHFQPDPRWDAPALPDGWDRPAATPSPAAPGVARSSRMSPVAAGVACQADTSRPA